MGIYFDHGLEYHVVLGGKHVCIASTRQTDARLLASKYYADRKASWFADCFVARCVKIEDADVDIMLTESERAKLDLHVVNVANVANVVNGWYDVVTVTDTYGPMIATTTTTTGYVMKLKDGSTLKVFDECESKCESKEERVVSERNAGLLESMLRVHGDDVVSHGWT